MAAHKGTIVGIAGDRLARLLARAHQPHLLFGIAAGLCCAAGMLLTAGGKLNQAGFLDPYVYVGYTHDYPALLERFGPTYYSERIAYIFPSRAFAYLFGLESGYFAFRFIALASAVAAAFAIGMRFYGFAPAILAAVWLSFTPWLPRSLLWTYPDGITVAYLLVGVAFLLVPNSRRLTSHAVAGAAFMLAVNCNLLSLAIGGLLAPSWVFFYRREGMVWLARAIFAVAFGFFATYIALALILYIKFPAYGFSFEIATIREAISLLDGRGQSWYKPLSTIIWQDKDFTLLIPITFALAALLVVVRPSIVMGKAKKHRDFAVLAASFLASIVGFSLIMHFGLHDAWLSLPYYTVYFVPGCVLALIALAGEAERRGGPIFGSLAVYCGAGLILVWWLACPLLPHLERASSFYLWLVVAATVAVAGTVAIRHAIASGVLVAGAVLLSMSLYQYQFYQIRTASSDQATEWDVYRGAIFLQQFVNANVRANQAIGFWYTGDTDSLLNSVQSVYLWDYTRVFPGEGAGMPLVDAQVRHRIAHGPLPPPLGRPITSLILLGISGAETDSGLAALQAAGLDFHEIQVKRAHFQGHSWGYTAVLVEMNTPNRTVGPLVADVPLASLDAHQAVSVSIGGFKPTNGASVLSHAYGLLVTTASPQWSYSLMGHLRPALETVRGPVVVRARLRVEEGAIGIAVSSRDNISNLIRREDSVRAGADMREICLYIPDPSAVDSLIIQNESNNGPSRAELYSVDLFLPSLLEPPEAASQHFNCDHYRS